MQCNTMKYNAIQCNTKQYDTLKSFKSYNVLVLVPTVRGVSQLEIAMVCRTVEPCHT